MRLHFMVLYIFQKHVHTCVFRSYIKGRSCPIVHFWYTCVFIHKRSFLSDCALLVYMRVQIIHKRSFLSDCALLVKYIQLHLSCYHNCTGIVAMLPQLYWHSCHATKTVLAYLLCYQNYTDIVAMLSGIYDLHTLTKLSVVHES